MLDLTQKNFVSKDLGRQGESLAADFLTTKNFRLVAANFIAPVGRNRRGAIVNAEIDLIAYEKAILCFIEVKTRSSREIAPESAVNLRKQRQITRAAKAYRRFFHLTNVQFRFDVVSVYLNQQQNETKIELFRNFWSETKFWRRQQEEVGGRK